MVGLACISPLMVLLMNLNLSMPPSMLLLLSMPLLTNHRPNLVSSVRRNSATREQPLLPKKLGVLKKWKVVDHKACLPLKSTKVAIASNLATKSMLRMKFSIRLMNSTLTIRPPNSYHLRTSTKSLWERFTEVKTRLSGLTLWANVSFTSALSHWHTCNISRFPIQWEERTVSARTSILSLFSCL